MPQFLDIPLTSGEPISLPIEPGAPLFIIGPNGSGKSALIQHAVTSLGPENVKRISAHRQTWLPSGNVDLTAQNRRQFDEQLKGQEPNPDYRWREWNAPMRLSSVLFDLTAKENTLARKIMNLAYAKDLEAVQTTIEGEVPVFERINQLLNIGRLDVTIENADGEQILARRPGYAAPYSIAQMSDGERNAVIIAADTLTVSAGTVLLIDEPERHLHRSIIEPLLTALFGLRTDCPFVVSTHEIELPIATPEARVAIIRSCRWAGNRASSWDAQVIESGAQLPDDLKRSILGSRRIILFVEGEPHKLDKPLYETLFPDISVIAKRSCNDVIFAVKGLRESSSHHHVEVLGLIDRDFRDEMQIAELAEQGIFALDVYSSESLYYCSDAVDAVACHQAEYYGLDVAKLRSAAKASALYAMKKDPDLAKRMAARRSEHIVRSQIEAQSPHWKSIQETNAPEITIAVSSPFSEELTRFESLIAEENLDEIIARYPIRESQVLGEIARALQIKREHYERLLPNLARSNRDLADQLRKRIQPLADAIEYARVQ